MSRGKVIAALFLVVAAVFAVATANDLVRYDDYDYIVKNEALADGLNGRAVRFAFCAAGYASNYHPLTWLSHAADVSLAKALGLDYRLDEKYRPLFCVDEGAFPHLVHGVNVLLHAVNAVLLFWLIMGMWRRSRSCASLTSGQETASPLLVVVAAGCVLFWALHPLRAEVVAWASERKELLCTAFMLLTLIAWTRGVAVEKSCTREFSNSTVHLHLFSTPSFCYIFSLFTFTFALLAKPMAVSLPVVLFAWEWVLRRVPFREALRRTAAFFVASAVMCHMTMVSQGEGLIGGRSWTLTQKVLASVEAPVIYLWQTVWPFGLSIDYPVPGRSSWPWFAAGCALLLAMAAAGVVHLLQRNGRLRTVRIAGADPVAWGVFAIAWLYVGLVPVLGFVKVGYEPHSDRYTYWVGCGAAVLLAKAVVWADGRWGACVRPFRTRILVGVAVLLAALGVLSVRQCRVWRNSISLFSSVVSKTAHEHYAHALADEMVFKDRASAKAAEEMLRGVLQQKHSPEARAALALHLAAFGEARKPISFGGLETSAFEEARLLAQYALEDPSSANDWAYAALAFADYREEKFENAIKWMRKAKDLGFDSGFLKIDLDEWAKEAEAKAKKAGQDVQR